ncbi:MFS transporter [Aeromicrobium sp. 179-A 4D2 NHS]|uniref:MFS transporter n=1 Tax=Aeromicrobium sp. 179-A 4D2 NHS TaxID=3142375 RepID=UPI0039A24A33
MILVERSVLRHRAYRHLFSAQVVALLGTGLLTVALSLLAFDVAPRSAGTVVATASTIKMVAYVLLSPLLTAATASLPPRRVMVAADLVRGGVAVSLPWVSEVWQIYVLIFVLQTASATFTPTFQAVIPAVLPDERDYTRALSLSRLAYDLESLVSPMIAAALLTVVSFHVLFAGTAVGFGVSAVMVITAGLSVRPHKAEVSFWRRATDGMRLFVTRGPLRFLMALNLVVAAASSLVLVNTVVVVRETLGLSSTSLAVALGCYGAGSMVVALAAPRLLDTISDRTLMLAGGVTVPAALVLAVLVTGGDHGWAPLLVIWAVIGAATSAILTPSGRVINRSVTEGERAGAFAANYSLSHACFLFAYPVAGWTGDQFGVPVTAAVMTAISVLGLAAAVASSRRPVLTR